MDSFLQEIRSCIIGHKYSIDGDTLYILEFEDKNVLSKLDDKQCITECFDAKGNHVYVEDLGEKINVNVNLSLFHLTKMGFYQSIDSFISDNKFKLDKDVFYILDIDYISNSNIEKPILIQFYQIIVQFINSLNNITEDKIKKNDTLNYFIFLENAGIVLPVSYDTSMIREADNIKISITEIEDVIDVFKEKNSEKRILYINELIDFLKDIEERQRFTFLIKNFNLYHLKCSNSFHYYLRNFSYNKLKTELDNAILDYSQKIRSVINDSQTKLIAIPAAFILAITYLDFSKIASVKNVLLIASLYIFSLLIHIFLKNQLSSLSIINNNIKNYKSSFQDNFMKESFVVIDKELCIQKRRLIIINYITWGIPIILTLTLLFLIKS